MIWSQPISQPRLTAQQSYYALPTLPFRVLWSQAPLHSGSGAHCSMSACNEGPFTPRPVYMFSLSHFSSQLEIHFLQETFPDRCSELASLPSCYVLCKYIEVLPWIGPTPVSNCRSGLIPPHDHCLWRLSAIKSRDHVCLTHHDTLGAGQHTVPSTYKKYFSNK